MAARAAKRSSPASDAGTRPAASVSSRTTPSASTTTGMASPWRFPTSKSLASCAGVILTAPDPKAGSVEASATTGTRTPVRGSASARPTSAWYRASSGCTATATSPSIVSGRVVATVIPCDGSSASG